jgi:hypothetical protein
VEKGLGGQEEGMGVTWVLELIRELLYIDEVFEAVKIRSQCIYDLDVGYIQLCETHNPYTSANLYT